MIYTPAHYQEKRSDLVTDVIKKFPFATILTIESDEPVISHLPLLLENETTLLGHCARANPQWRHFADGRTATSIFHGPHAYISPAWYTPKAGNVPTWNYVAVHVRGKPRIVDDLEQSAADMKTIVSAFEGKYKTGWTLPEEMNSELASLHKAIVVFRIDIQKIEAKFKLSQKQDALNRENVILELPRNQGHDGQLVADYMRLTN